MLSSASTYFASLFSEQWSGGGRESGEPEEVKMVVEEELGHAEMLLEFLYGRELTLDLVCAHPLLRLAGAPASTSYADVLPRRCELLLSARADRAMPGAAPGYYGVDPLNSICIDYLERVLHPVRVSPPPRA